MMEAVIAAVMGVTIFLCWHIWDFVKLKIDMKKAEGFIDEIKAEAEARSDKKSLDDISHDLNERYIDVGSKRLDDT